MKINYDKHADSYGKTRNIEPIVYEILSYLLHPIDGDIILDFGCGTGNYLERFSVDYADCNVTMYGVEPSAKMRKIAQEKILSDHILNGNHLHIPFDENLFSKIYCTDVIHHIEQLEPFFKNLLIVAQTGARLCICTESSQQLTEKYWIKYFPSILQIDSKRFYPVDTIIQTGEMVGWKYKKTLKTESEMIAPISYSFMERVRKKALSVLNLISNEEYECGISLMEADFRNKSVFYQQEGYTFILFEKELIDLKYN